MDIIANFGESQISWKAFEHVSGAIEVSTDPNCQVNEFLKIITGRDFTFLPPEYQALTTHFVSSSQIAPRLMPKERLKASLKEVEETLDNVFASNESKSYFYEWSKIHAFIQKMKPAKIDVNALESLISSLGGDAAHALRTFMPISNEMLPAVRYSTCGSATGRLTVESGPSILTADHRVRNCLRSSYSSGKIVMVDFVSVEPRVAMVSVGMTPPEDVYDDILEEFPSLTRKAAKLVTLAALYGSGASRLSEIAGSVSDARKAVSFVKSHFRVDRLERQLSEMAETGTIRNIFGRPLLLAANNPRVRTNHYLQSSAAELCVLLFSELCQGFKSGVRPLFVIHDALIVDLRSDVEESFLQQAKSITWKNGRMPVKIETLSPI